jgi:hypothetical protein
MFKSVMVFLLVVFYIYTAYAENGKTSVATWKYNSRGAFTMSFDDSMQTHAKLAIPAIIEKGLVGTWFINPGQPRHVDNKSVWEVDGPNNGQEYANHTWEHIGAKNYHEAEFQIGECARYIWTLRGPGKSKLLAFNKGGGTTWNITDSEMEEIKRKYKCINRTSEMSVRADLGIHSEMIINKARESISEGRWVAIHFHGIGDEWLSIDSDAFFLLLDYLNNNKDKIWSAGWSAAYQYIQERDHAHIDLLEKSANRIRINLKTGLDTELYVEPLTLITQVPDSWAEVKVTQNGKFKVYHPKNGVLQYEVIPDKGEIELQPNTR